MTSLTELKKDLKTDYFEVSQGVWGMRILFVNVFMIEDISTGEWVLVDAGLKGSSNKIIKMAEDLFGKGSIPSAIILTHAHFDHVGALEAILQEWNVPVYAHKMEMPYILGVSSYPPPDPTAGGGLMTLLSWTFPKDPIDISPWAEELNEDGNIPFIKEWEFIHTPGHTPGHISLFRRADKVLIAGDAIVTTQQESVFSVMTQEKKICGPPRYYTPDWPSAFQSVKKLSELNPKTIAAGHGKPFSGGELQKDLDDLVAHFYEKSVPEESRYNEHPARANDKGVIFIPPLNTGTIIKTSISFLFGALVAMSLISWVRSNRRSF